LAFAQFLSLEAVLEAATTRGDDVVIESSDLSLVLKDTALNDLTLDTVLLLG